MTGLVTVDTGKGSNLLVWSHMGEGPCLGFPPLVPQWTRPGFRGPSSSEKGKPGFVMRGTGVGV